MFVKGIIEGFYGRVWPWPRREELITFLADWQLDLYVYAPKADRHLRRDWRLPWPAADESALAGLRNHARRHRVGFGVGLSPWGLQSEYLAADAVALRQKVQQLNRLDLDWLCILFDDMPGEGRDLAMRQGEIVADIVDASTARHFAMCPSWYSFDPQLEALFGAMPEDYLRDLGKAVPAAVEVFWTGPQVVSTAYGASDFLPVAHQLGRSPLLWDNYPVNDGRRISRFLHLLPLTGRPAELRQWCRGHLLNPMNQPLLSKSALASMSVLYGEAGGETERMQAWWRDALPGLVGQRTARLLLRDTDRFQRAGLDSIESAERTALATAYRQNGEPASVEIADWLDEQYRFDPECLND